MILSKLNIFTKKLLCLGTPNDNMHESWIPGKDKTKSCQKQGAFVLHASGAGNVCDAMKFAPEVIVFIGEATYLYCIHHSAVKEP